MQGFHIPAAPPLYTNTFLLISDAGHAVVIDPAAEVHSYDEILKQHNATPYHHPVHPRSLRPCGQRRRPEGGVERHPLL